MTQEYRPSLRSWFNSTPEERAANRRLFLSFQGRVGRRTYWQFAAAPAFTFTVLTALFELPLRMGSFGFTVCALFLSWVVLAVSVKRCHDRGRSGWFLLVKLIPIVGALWVLVELGFLAAAEGAERYEARSPSELADAADA